MNVHSYFELATTLTGWHIANGLAQILVSSGLVLLPLIVLIWRNWSEPIRSQSMRDGAAVSLRRMEVDTLLTVLVMVFAFLPAIPVSRDEIRFSQPYTETPTTAQSPTAPYIDQANAVEGIRVPIFWWLVYQISSLVTDGVVTVIDGLGNPAVLRASLLRISQLSITDTGLIAELGQFRRDCYEPALAKYQRAANPIAATNHFEAVDWVGSLIFVRTEGYYRACPDVQICGSGYQARTPVPGWQPRPGQVVGSRLPQCDVWWDDTQSGLRVRLLENLHQQSPSFRRDVQRVIDSMDAERLRTNPDLVRHFEDRILRRMLNQVPRIMVERADREDGIFFNSLGLWSVDGLQQILASLGALVLSGLLHIVMELVVMGLPMLQALMLMLLYVVLPLVVPYAALQPGIIVRAAVLLFALRFVSALWAIAEFLDEKLLKTMYPDAMILEFGGSGTVADVVLGLITLTAYLSLPLAWFLLIGALSSRAASALAGSWSQLSSRLDQSAMGSMSEPLKGTLRSRRF